MFSKITTEIVVKNIVADRFGGIKIFLNEDILLEIIPDNSTEDEAWRFFRVGADSEHTVITGVGIDRE